MSQSTPSLSWIQKNSDALLESLTLFCLLFITLIGISVYYDFSSASFEQLQLIAFVFAAFSCVLIAKNTYDIRRLSRLASAVDSITAASLATDNESLFKQVYHNSPVPYVLIDQAGVIMSANMAATRLFKSTQTTITNTSLFARLATENSSHVQFLFTKFQGGIAVSGEEVQVLYDAEDAPAWVLLSMYPFIDSNQSTTGLVTLVDITKQKQIENAKAEFVSLASHQLRTPIAGMRWSAELLLMDNPAVLSDRQKKYVNRMLESVERMNVLVDDFLRVSRFELGTFIVESVQLSLAQMISEVQTDHAATIRKKQLEFTADIDPRLTSITADPNLMRMIVTNLLTNAIKYTPMGGQVFVGAVVDNERYILTIKDSGMGIPIGDQPQIFQKLYRASNATREVPDGTGLGLYIVREAVQVLGGRISFVSAEGMGTTFTVILPFEPTR